MNEPVKVIYDFTLEKEGVYAKICKIYRLNDINPLFGHIAFIGSILIEGFSCEAKKITIRDGISNTEVITVFFIDRNNAELIATSLELQDKDYHDYIYFEQLFKRYGIYEVPFVYAQKDSFGKVKVADKYISPQERVDKMKEILLNKEVARK